jgi:hypothetical protein
MMHTKTIFFPPLAHITAFDVTDVHPPARPDILSYATAAARIGEGEGGATEVGGIREECGDRFLKRMAHKLVQQEKR